MIDEALVECLKELDDDVIFADLKMVLGGKLATTSSLTKATSAESGTKPIDTPTVKILADCYEMIKGKDLHSLGIDEDYID